MAFKFCSIAIEHLHFRQCHWNPKTALLIRYLWPKSANPEAWQWPKGPETSGARYSTQTGGNVCKYIGVPADRYQPCTNKVIQQTVCFFHFHMIRFFQGGNGLLLFWAKYLMFPLFEQVHKQMRQEQFIVLTITFWHFPTVWPGLPVGPRLPLRAVRP